MMDGGNCLTRWGGVMAYAKSDLPPGASSPWSAAAIQPPARWYCVEAHPGRERESRDRLNDQDFVAYLPLYGKRRIRDGKAQVVIRVLFPGYLFVAFDRQCDQWRPICSTRGVKRLFGTSPECPTPLPTGAVERMLATASIQSCVPDHILAELDAARITPIEAAKRAGLDTPPQIAPGQMVRVTSGAVAGQVVTVEWSDHRRVRVLMGLLGETTVTLDRRAVVSVA